VLVHDGLPATTPLALEGRGAAGEGT
jgi:hypothetical protein